MYISCSPCNWCIFWAVAQHDQGGNDNSKTDDGLDDNARHNGSNDITGYNTDDYDVPPSTTPTWYKYCNNINFTYLCTATDLTHRFANTMQTSVPMQAAHISTYIIVIKTIKLYLHIDQNQHPEPLRGSASGFILLSDYPFCSYFRCLSKPCVERLFTIMSIYFYYYLSKPTFAVWINYRYCNTCILLHTTVL